MVASRQATDDVYNAIAALPSLSRKLKAINLDAVSYKPVMLDLTNPGFLLLRTAQTITASAYVEHAYNSDNLAYAQRLDLTNGGMLFISSSARYIVIESNTNTGAVGASTGNGATGVAEYTRDDDWNVAPYTAHAWFNIGLWSNWYVPILKNTAITDVTGSNAYLEPVVSSIFTKLIIKQDSSTVLPATPIKLRAKGTTTTYGSLGGTVQGDILLGCEAYGNLGDVVTIGAATYTVLTAGATTRLLVKNA